VQVPDPAGGEQLKNAAELYWQEVFNSFIKD